MTSSEPAATFLAEKAAEVPQQGSAPASERNAPVLTAPDASSAAAEPPEVRLRRLACVASWALALVLAGSVSAIVGLFHIFGDGPGWFTPAFISTGVTGMLLTMMAFATLRFRGVPWMFMAAASVTLLAAFAMLSIA